MNNFQKLFNDAKSGPKKTIPQFCQSTVYHMIQILHNRIQFTSD